MKKLYSLLLIFSISVVGFSQPTDLPSKNLGTTGDQPQFAPKQTRAAGDSCGAYWNRYVPIAKTNSIGLEYMFTGSDTVAGAYGGRAQRYYANQAIEVSGVQFYAYDADTTADSIQVIVTLHEYDALNDTVGTLLAQDTGMVIKKTYSAFLPSREIDIEFDAPVTVTDDYVVSVWNPTNDTIILYTNDFGGGEGQGEGISYAIYNNEEYPSFIGYYHTLSFFGPGYDGDYMIDPKIKFQLHDGFTLSDNSVCPGALNAACVEYSRDTIYHNPHYNAWAATADQHNVWFWGDGLQNTNISTACHTYDNSGNYDITHHDTLRRYRETDVYCVAEQITPIEVLDDPVADFTWSNNTTWITFDNNSTYADSVLWDFGDSTSSTSYDTWHVYDSVGTFDVTLIIYGECANDTVTQTVTTDNVGIEDYDFDFKIYPNPANNNVNISGLIEGTNVEVLNIIGEAVRYETANSNTMILGTQGLSNGTYFIRVSTDFGQVTKKLMIRH